MQGYVAAVFAAIVFAASGAAYSAAQPSSPYAIDVSVLTGPQGGELTIDVDTVAETVSARSFEHVHVSLRSTLAQERIVNLNDVPAPNGVATIELGPLERGAAVGVVVQVGGEPSSRTVVLRGEATARLRPDLVVAAVHAPPQTLTTRPVDVVADVAELNGDTAAQATLTLMLGPTPLAESKTVTVAAGGTKSVTFEGVKLESAMSSELTVRIEGADPYETDATNNSRTRQIEVTVHELIRSNVLVPSLGGYGAQFNNHVYAPVTSAPVETLPDMEAKVKALEPQLVRIFYNDNWEERLPTAPENLASFIRSVELAQDAGATINITYQTASVARLQPLTSMARFAGVLKDLVVDRGLTNVRWVTVQNEPNTPGAALTLEQYEGLYRALHAELVTRGLRDHIKLMGGDLIESSGARHQEIWFAYIAEHMSDVVDAYSAHIYWNYWDIPRMEFRLKDVRRIVTAFEAAAKKPTYIMEFAPRGANSFPGKPTVMAAYYEDGTEFRRTTLAAFQLAWFNIVSAQLGYTGTSKWDAYWGRYDNTLNNQSYWMVGTAAEGWPIFPSYHSLRLLLQTTQRGWQVVQVAPWETNDWEVGTADQPEKEIVAYAAGEGELTLMGLDTHARALNATSTETPSYSVGGLLPLTAFNLVLWNATGNGENSLAGTVTTDAAGVARFEVPLHAAFALTTVPVS